MANDYGEYYGCYVVFVNKEIVDIRDLEEPMGDPYIGDEMHTCVKCGYCDCWMEHKKKTWKCPECGASVRQSKVYDAIQEENLKWRDYDDYY